MLCEQANLRIAPDVSYESLGAGEGTVILSLASGYLYTCNDTTARFLKAMEEHTRFGAVVDQLASRFDVHRERLILDLSRLVDELVGEGILTVEQ